MKKCDLNDNNANLGWIYFIQGWKNHAFIPFKLVSSVDLVQVQRTDSS